MSLLSTDYIFSKEMFLMELAAKRNFEVKYYEKDETTWVVESHVIDLSLIHILHLVKLL